MNGSSGHDEAHEELLASVFAGDVPEDAAALRTLLAECAECRSQVQELRRVVESLNADAAEEKEALRAATRGPVAGEEHVAEVLHRAAPGTAQAPFPRRRWGLLALAALLLAAVALWRLLPRPQPGNPPPELRMGAGSPLLALERTEGGLAFSWEATLPAGGWFELRVWDAAPGHGPPLVERLDEDGPRCTVPRDAAAWPEEVRWEVRGFDAAGQQIFVGERTDPVPAGS